jgi:hypothetical protein
MGQRPHPRQQFKARFLRTSPPTSVDGIEKYISSSMVRGVGPVYAKKLVRAFGEKAFDIIETAPDRLREVEGIGPVRAASIVGAWVDAFNFKGGGARKSRFALTQEGISINRSPSCDPCPRHATC